MLFCSVFHRSRAREFSLVPRLVVWIFSPAQSCCLLICSHVSRDYSRNSFLRTTVRSPLLELFLPARFDSSALDPAVCVLLSRSHEAHRLGVQVLLAVFHWLMFWTSFLISSIVCGLLQVRADVILEPPDQKAQVFVVLITLMQ
jgi:hypothetical protein